MRRNRALLKYICQWLLTVQAAAGLVMPAALSDAAVMSRSTLAPQSEFHKHKTPEQPYAGYYIPERYRSKIGDSEKERYGEMFRWFADRFVDAQEDYEELKDTIANAAYVTFPLPLNTDVCSSALTAFTKQLFPAQGIKQLPVPLKRQLMIAVFKIAKFRSERSLDNTLKIFRDKFRVEPSSLNDELKQQLIISVHNVSVRGAEKGFERALNIFGKKLRLNLPAAGDDLKKQVLIAAYNIAVNGGEKELGDTIDTICGEFGISVSGMDEEMQKQVMIAAYNTAMHNGLRSLEKAIEIYRKKFGFELHVISDRLKRQVVIGAYNVTMTGAETFLGPAIDRLGAAFGVDPAAVSEDFKKLIIKASYKVAMRRKIGAERLLQGIALFDKGYGLRIADFNEHGKMELLSALFSVITEDEVPVDRAFEDFDRKHNFISKMTGASPAVSHIAKRARVVRIEGAAVTVRDAQDQERTMQLTAFTELPLSLLKNEAMKNKYSGMLLSIIKSLELLPFHRQPKFWTFSFLIDDLIGFVSVEHKIIALHEAFAEDTVPLLHEISEYVIQEGAVRLELAGGVFARMLNWMCNRLYLYAIFKDMTGFSAELVLLKKVMQEGAVVWKEFQRMPVSGISLSIAQKAVTVPHNLIRALTLTSLGDADRALSMKIKEIRRPPVIETMPLPDLPAQFADETPQVSASEPVEAIPVPSTMQAEGVLRKFAPDQTQRYIVYSLLSALGGENIQLSPQDYLRIAYVFIDANQPDAALRMIRSALARAKNIWDAYAKAESIAECAVAYARAKRAEEALAAAEEITDVSVSQRDAALERIALACAKNGMMHDAMHAIDRITPGPSERSRALSTIVVELVRAGRVSEALDMRTKSELTAEGRLYVAVLLAKLGRIDEARALAEESVNAQERDCAFSNVASNLADADKVNEALGMIGEISSSWYRASAIKDIAVALARNGKIDDALKQASLLDDANLQTNCVKELIKQKQVEVALTVAQKISDPSGSAQALHECVTALWSQGKSDRARDILSQALVSAGKIRDAYVRGRVLGILVDGIAVRLMDESIRTHVLQMLGEARSLATTEKNSTALISIACAYAQMGELTAAMDIGLSMKQWFPYSTLSELSGLVHVLIGKGYVDNALAVAKEISDPYSLRMIVVSLVRKGDYDRALKIVRPMSDGEERVSAFCEIVAANIIAGDATAAERLMQEIQVSKYDKALAGILLADILCSQGGLSDAYAEKLFCWLENGLPYTPRMLDRYLAAPDPKAFIAGLVRSAVQAVSNGFACDNPDERLLAYIGTGAAGVRLTFEQFEERISALAQFDKKHPGSFAALFRKAKDMQTYELSAQELRTIDPVTVDMSVFDAHLDMLLKIRDRIDSLAWLSKEFEGSKVFNLRNIYYKMQQQAKIDRGEVKEGERFRVEYPPDEVMLKEVQKNRKLLYKVIFLLAKDRVKDRDIGQKCVTLMRDLIICNSLLDEELILAMRSPDPADRINIFRLFYDDYAAHLPDSLRLQLSQMKGLPESLKEISKEVFDAIARIKLVKTKGLEAYTLVPVGFLGVFRGRAGMIDCSFDMSKGSPFTRAMHEDTVYYFVYKGKELKGYVGMMVTQNEQGEKIMIVDTINSPSLDGEDLLTNLYSALASAARGRGCTGIALPAELRASFNFENKQTIVSMELYRAGVPIQVRPLHKDTWQYFTDMYGADEYNSIDRSSRFILVSVLSREGAPPAKAEYMKVKQPHYSVDSIKDGMAMKIAGADEAKAFGEKLLKEKLPDGTPRAVKESVTVKGRKFDIIIEQGSGLTAEAVAAQISEALARTKAIGGDISKLPKTLVFVLLDTSSHLFEDHIANGFIGINRSLLAITDDKVRNILLQVGIFHELCHEVTARSGDEFEAEQLVRDAGRAHTAMIDAGISSLERLEPVFLEYFERQPAARFMNQIILMFIKAQMEKYEASSPDKNKRDAAFLQPVPALVKESHRYIEMDPRLGQEFNALMDEVCRGGDFEKLFAWLKRHTFMRDLSYADSWKMKERTGAVDVIIPDIEMKRVPHIEHMMYAGLDLFRKVYTRLYNGIYSYLKGKDAPEKPGTGHLVALSALETRLGGYAESQLLSELRRPAYLALALHDYGKIFKERPVGLDDEQRNGDPYRRDDKDQHRIVGSNLAVELMRSLGVSEFDRKVVWTIIRLHDSLWNLYSLEKSGTVSNYTTPENLAYDVNETVAGLKRLNPALAEDVLRDNLLKIIGAVGVADVYASGDRLMDDDFIRFAQEFRNLKLGMRVAVDTGVNKVEVIFDSGDRFAKGRAVILDPAEIEIVQEYLPEALEYDFGRYRVASQDKQVIAGEKEFKKFPGQTLKQFVQGRGLEKKVVAASNSLHSNFWSRNAFLIVNGKVINKPETVLALFEERYMPLNGKFWVFVFDTGAVGVKEVLMTDGEMDHAGKNIKNGVAGLPLVMNGRNVSGLIEKGRPLVSGHQQTFDDPAKEAAAMAAVGRDKNGNIILLNMAGDTNVKKEMTFNELAQAMIALGAVEAVSLGVSADVNQYLRGDKDQYIAAKARAGSLTAPDYPDGRPLGAFILAYPKQPQKILTVDKFLQKTKGEQMPLVLGGNGFVGSHMVDELLAKGEKVAMFVRGFDVRRLEKNAAHFDNPNFYCVGTRDMLKDVEGLKKMIAHSSIVYDFAADANAKETDVNKVFNLFTINGLLTGLVAACANEYKKKVVYASTAHFLLFVKDKEHPVIEETPLPVTREVRDWIAQAREEFSAYIARYVKGEADMSPSAFVEAYVKKRGDSLEDLQKFFGAGQIYGTSKMLGEEFIKALEPGRGVILRFCNVYGPWCSDKDVIGLVTKRLIDGLGVSASLDSRQFIYVRDLTDAARKAGESSFSENEIFIISPTGPAVPMQALLTELMRAFYGEGRDFEVKPGPVTVICPPFDASKAQAKLGLEIRTPLRQGIEETVDWYKKRYNYVEPLKKALLEKRIEAFFGAQSAAYFPSVIFGNPLDGRLQTAVQELQEALGKVCPENVLYLTPPEVCHFTMCNVKDGDREAVFSSTKAGMIRDLAASGPVDAVFTGMLTLTDDGTIVLKADDSDLLGKVGGLRNAITSDGWKKPKDVFASVARVRSLNYTAEQIEGIKRVLQEFNEKGPFRKGIPIRIDTLRLGQFRPQVELEPKDVATISLSGAVAPIPGPVTPAKAEYMTVRQPFYSEQAVKDGRQVSIMKPEDVRMLFEVYWEVLGRNRPECERLLRALAEYLALRQEELPVKPDVIMVLGSADLSPVDEAERLFKKYANDDKLKIIVSGGIGRLTGTLAKPEAQVYRDELVKRGIPADRIIVEDRSSNTGENVRNSKGLLDAAGISVKNIALIQTPLLQKRADATVRKEYAGQNVSVYNRAPSLTDPAKMTAAGLFANLRLAIGEIERLEEYAKKGKEFIVPVADPKNEAWVAAKDSALRLQKIVFSVQPLPADRVSKAQISVEGRTIDVVIEKGSGLTAEAVQALISEALARTRYIGGDIKKLPQTLVFALLDKSSHMFEDHTANGFIGINRALFEIKDEKIRNILLQVGIFHELCHEMTGKLQPDQRASFEKAQIECDAKYTCDVMIRAGLEGLNLIRQGLERIRTHFSTTPEFEIFNALVNEEAVIRVAAGLLSAQEVEIVPDAAAADWRGIKEKLKDLYEKKYKKPIDERRLFDGVAAVFGVDEPNDIMRIEQTKIILTALSRLQAEKQNEITASIVNELEYATYSASGAHRFMPLALATINILSGNDVLSPEKISELVSLDPGYRYLTTLYTQFANAFDVEDEWVPKQMPPFALRADKLRSKSAYRWLDIGSAPKAHGAPTLNLLKNAMEQLQPGKKFEFFGADVMFPKKKFEDGVFSDTTFGAQWAEFGKTGRLNVDGVTYLNAARPENDVMSDAFDAGEFDFISICMTIHHLQKPGEKPVERGLAAGVKWFDEQGGEIHPVAPLTETQQAALGNMLRSLDDGGILFLGLSGASGKGNYDLFLVVQKVSDGTYMLHSRAIPYRPNYEEYHPSQYLLTADKNVEYRHPGLAFSSYANIGAEFYRELVRWFKRADLLAYRYQARGASIWEQMKKVTRAIREGTSLFELFSIYLEHVPDSEPLKMKLLAGVQQFEVTFVKSPPPPGIVPQPRSVDAEQQASTLNESAA